MKYPLENLTDKEFEDLVVLICERILGMGTINFSVGKDGGKDAKFRGKANCFPSESEPWDGKIIIQAKHTQRPNASCSDPDFKSILKNDVVPSIRKLKKNGEIDYYLLFTNRKLSGIQEAKIEKFLEEAVSVENRIIGLEKIYLWLEEYPEIAKIADLNKLLLPLQFDESDLKIIINAFNKSIQSNKETISKVLKEIKRVDIEVKNELNRLSKNYFDNVIKKNLIYFQQIEGFLKNPINKEFKNKYLNTIDDINAIISLHREQYDKFEFILEYLYKFVLNSSPELKDNRRLVRLFLHYMYYYCDIGEEVKKGHKI